VSDELQNPISASNVSSGIRGNDRLEMSLRKHYFKRIRHFHRKHFTHDIIRIFYRYVRFFFHTDNIETAAYIIISKYCGARMACPAG